MQLPWN